MCIYVCIVSPPARVQCQAVGMLHLEPLFVYSAIPVCYIWAPCTCTCTPPGWCAILHALYVYTTRLVRYIQTTCTRRALGRLVFYIWTPCTCTLLAWCDVFGPHVRVHHQAGMLYLDPMYVYITRLVCYIWASRTCTPLAWYVIFGPPVRVHHQPGMLYLDFMYVYTTRLVCYILTPCTCTPVGWCVIF